MAKYFMTWDADEHLWPVDSKEQAALGMKLGELIQRAIKEGKLSDWGIFIGGDRGYAIGEGNAANLYTELQQYHPYIDFMVHQVLSKEKNGGTEIKDEIERLVLSLERYYYS